MQLTFFSYAEELVAAGHFCVCTEGRRADGSLEEQIALLIMDQEGRAKAKLESWEW